MFQIVIHNIYTIKDLVCYSAQRNVKIGCYDCKSGAHKNLDNNLTFILIIIIKKKPLISEQFLTFLICSNEACSIILNPFNPNNFT